MERATSWSLSAQKAVVGQFLIASWVLMSYGAFAWLSFRVQLKTLRPLLGSRWPLLFLYHPEGQGTWGSWYSSCSSVYVSKKLN